jgi:hypothetical protein
VTRRVGRCATGVWGKVEKKPQKKLRKKDIEVNFTSTVHFSQKADNNENNNSLMKKSSHSKIPKTSIRNVPDAKKITLQCTFTIPPFTLVKPPVSVFSQLLFGLGVLFHVSLHLCIFVCYLYFILVILLFLKLVDFYFFSVYWTWTDS